MRSRRTKACEFSQEARTRIWNRDQGCIFCQMNYHMAPEEFTATQGLQIMHFIPRSQGGLGIPENGAVGCIYHHTLLDNGRDTRAEMLEIFENYLKDHYKEWDRKKLVFSKW